MKPTISSYFFLLILILTLNVIIPFSGVKATPDSKYNVAIRTLNLDGEPVADLNVTVYDLQGEAISSEKTNETGWAFFSLKAGNYIFKALWHNVTVGSLSKNVTDNVAYVLSCQLVKTYIKVVNLNREPLPQVRVEVYNWSDPQVPLETGKTNQSGMTAGIPLLNGTQYLFKVFMEEFEVANLSQYVDSSGVVSLEARVAHLKVTVTDENGEPLPNIDVRLSWRFVDRHGQIVFKEDSFKTNSTGSVKFYDMFVDAQYELEALREGVLFSKTNLTDLTPLLTDGWAHVEILCPHVTLRVQVLDSKGNPLSNVHVDLYEAESGLLKETAVTNSSGWASFQQLPGRYGIEARSYSTVLQKEIILSRTILNLTEGLASLVLRSRGFNITLSILVVDCLSQPMSNVQVEVRSDDLQVESLTTLPDGTASVDGLVKGNYRISVYVSGRLSEVISIHVDGSREITVKIDRYLMLAGYPIEVGQFVGLLSVSLIVAAFLSALIYKRIPFIRRVEKSL